MWVFGVLTAVSFGLFMYYILSTLQWSGAFRKHGDLNVVFKTYLKANEMTSMLPQIAKNEHLLNYFEQTLGMLEQLVRVVLKMKKEGEDNRNISASIKHLAKCLDLRMARLQRSLREINEGEKLHLQSLYKKDWLRGSYCYFCSKPLIGADKFAASIPNDKKRIKVSSCGGCRAAYEKKGQIRVLSFLEDGEVRHWSMSKEFLPQEKYWHINTGGAKEPAVPKLMLVSDVKNEQDLD